MIIVQESKNGRNHLTMAKKTESTELAVIGESKFMALSNPITSLTDLIDTNLGGETIDQFALERIHVPSGGGTFFEVLDENDEPQMVKEIEGIFIHHKIARAYWASGLDEAGAVAGPPDCSSEDGIIGNGLPGGECKNCPYNSWKSAGEGKSGKACREFRHVFILPKDSLLPIVVTFPPTSTKNWRDFVLRKIGRGQNLNARTIKFSLKAVEANPPYSKINVKSGEPLSEEQVAFVSKYAESIIPYLSSVDLSNEAPVDIE